jgi:hypothetical protein
LTFDALGEVTAPTAEVEPVADIAVIARLVVHGSLLIPGRHSQTVEVAEAGRIVAPKPDALAANAIEPKTTRAVATTE